MDYAWPLFIAIACVALGNLLLLPLGYFRMSRRKENKELLTNGIQTQAEIIGYRDCNLQHKQWVKYQFTTELQETITCEKRIASHEKRLPIGSQVTVYYMQKHPSISILLPYAATQEPTS